MKLSDKQASTKPNPVRRMIERNSTKASGAYTRAPQSRKHASDALVPYWHLLPLWLSAKYRRGKRASRSDARFLDRVVRAQYLLFRAIRMQDDVYDGQIQSMSLIFKADQLLFEAEKMFSEFFPGSSKFWKVYWDSMRSTTQSIVDVDTLQQRGNSPASRLLEGYAKICALFKISSAAVCAREKRWRDFARVSTFCDEMAKAGQIIDDLRDIGEDLKRKRFNYVVNVLYKASAKKGSLEEAPAVVAQNFFRGDGFARVFLEIRHHLAAGQKAIHPLKLAEATEFLFRFGSEVDSLERSFDATRIEFAFSGLPLMVGAAGSSRRHRSAGKPGI